MVVPSENNNKNSDVVLDPLFVGDINITLII